MAKFKQKKCSNCGDNLDLHGMDKLTGVFGDKYGCGNPKKPTYAVIKKDGKTFVRETKYKDGIKSMELREI